MSLRASFGTPETFDDWWQSAGQAYEVAVVARGGTPWPHDPDKRAAVAARLGLPIDTDAAALREALWNHRNKKREA